MTERYPVAIMYAICWVRADGRPDFITSVVHIYRNRAIREFLALLLTDYDLTGRYSEALDPREAKKWRQMRKKGVRCERVIVQVDA